MIPVACVSVSSALGGSEWVLRDFATRARNHGVDPLVILPKEGPLGERLREDGIRIAIAPASDDFLELSQRELRRSPETLVRFSRGMWRWSRAIAAECDRAELLPPGRPRVLYTNGFKAHLACALLRGYRRVWHLHEFPPDSLGFAWRAVAAAVPDAAIAVSRSVGEAWRTPSLRPDVVFNGVDTERFKPARRTFWVHDLLGLAHEARLIGMPAVFARWKGHLQVVEAFERVAAQVPNAHLVLVGGPIYDTVAERGYAQELARRVGRSSIGGASARSLNDRIHFVRFQNDPWRLYPEFDLVVHFSTRPEPFGRVILEAMACATPVIAVNAGGPAEIVEDGVTGWLTPMGDVGALGARIVAGLAADAARLGAAARHAVEARFTAERFSAEVSAVLKRAAGPGPGAPPGPAPPRS
ncbi:MAG TPA: glycosyltransferase [Gemmatimonadales bacterium]|nr:glycosyltransferase [Gemmatimonadales bacterium]